MTLNAIILVLQTIAMLRDIYTPNFSVNLKLNKI